MAAISTTHSQPSWDPGPRDMGEGRALLQASNDCARSGLGPEWEVGWAADWRQAGGEDSKQPGSHPRAFALASPSA